MNQMILRIIGALGGKAFILSLVTMALDAYLAQAGASDIAIASVTAAGAAGVTGDTYRNRAKENSTSSLVMELDK